MARHAPNEILRVSSASDPTPVVESNTDVMLGVTLDWTVPVQIFGGIASQIILEDYVVCAAAGTTSTRERRAMSNQSTHE